MQKSEPALSKLPDKAVENLRFLAYDTNAIPTPKLQLIVEVSVNDFRPFFIGIGYEALSSQEGSKLGSPSLLGQLSMSIE
jgi:hypothetical protein